MPTYKVTVPFEAIRLGSLGASFLADLPDTFELQAATVVRDAEGAYRAKLQVVAPSTTAAKQCAVDEVREILRVMATWGDAFDIRFGSGLTAERLTDEPQPTPESDRGDIGGSATIHVVDEISIEMIGHISLVKRRASMDFEKAALSWRAQWPGWLPTALELNHLAVISCDPKSSLAILYSVLEVLTKGVEDDPVSIIAHSLGAEVSRGLMKEMRKVLKIHGLEEACVTRILNRVKDTQLESNVNRIVTALRKLGVEATSEDVAFVVARRGSIVHSGESGIEDLQRAHSLAGDWVRTALRNILGRRSPAPVETAVC